MTHYNRRWHDMTAMLEKIKLIFQDAMSTQDEGDVYYFIFFCKQVTLLFFAKSRELTECSSKEAQVPRLVTREDLVSSIIDLFPR